MVLYHSLLIPEIIPFPKTAKQFQEIKVDLPFLKAWQGEMETLPRYQYLLTVVKLTGWAAPTLNQITLEVPMKLNPATTHEISCFFQTPSRAINLLFNFQIRTNDKSAARLAHGLATGILNSKATDGQYLTNTRLANFWKDISILKLATLDGNGKLWSGDQCKI